VDTFFDSSVLVAASEERHPHYTQARPAMLRVVAGRDRGFISAHSIAEVYAALTRLPVRPRMHPAEAARILTGNILPHFQLVPLAEADYLEALEIVAAGGWPGAKVYDALLLQCAAKCGAQRVYTFNLEDFRQLAPDALRRKICAP
jgi:predicted nucleic acid-binding protein